MKTEFDNNIINKAYLLIQYRSQKVKFGILGLIESSDREQTT